VLSVGHEPFLDLVTPSVACYGVNRLTLARKLCRAVLPWVKTGIVAPEGTVLLPEFHDGGSLGRPGR